MMEFMVNTDYIYQQSTNILNEIIVSYNYSLCEGDHDHLSQSSSTTNQPNYLYQYLLNNTQLNRFNSTSYLQLLLLTLKILS
ncbi:unnamed protein product [Rotaria sp. Silwood2]|nr:unnamed protein product [Rotaria sp. Silwood2]CAF4304138.1 unnamed protein product [Rotaria sp. Silwood2]